MDDSEGAGMLVLIDFSSARRIGTLMGMSRGTTGWIQGRNEDYTTSRKEHYLFALENMRGWWDNPTFQEEYVETL